jgi:hypothetical protein
MLSDLAKTALFSLCVSWVTVFVIACEVRTKTLTGFRSPSLVLKALYASLPKYLADSGRALKSWYPVPMLLLIAGLTYSEGLVEIAAISLASAFIVQLWRFEFPCVPALTTTLGWDAATVLANLSLILPPHRRVFVVGGVWLVAVGAFVAVMEAVFAGALSLVAGGLLTRGTLRAAIERAISLERE